MADWERMQVAEDSGPHNLLIATNCSSGSFLGDAPEGGIDKPDQTLSYSVQFTDEAAALRLLVEGSVQIVGETLGEAYAAFEPRADAYGTLDLRVIVSDSGGTSNGGTNRSADAYNVTISITPVNDPPTYIPAGPDIITVMESLGDTSFERAFATSMRPGGGEPQSVAWRTDYVSDPTLFSRQPTIDSAGMLHFSLAKNASGSTTVSGILVDSDGGESVPKAINITVLAVNGPPSFSLENDFDCTVGGACASNSPPATLGQTHVSLLQRVPGGTGARTVPNLASLVTASEGFVPASVASFSGAGEFLGLAGDAEARIPGRS